jgi:D-sedoheptulose 7-phosphate isomerase
MPSTAVGDILRASLESARSVLTALLSDAATLERLAKAGEALQRCYATGNKVIICGNGGSLCDASHFAEELTGRFRDDRPPLPAIAVSEPGHLTCTANDYGFDQVFARSVKALGKPGDVVILLSTSGNSPNCVVAAETASQMGLTTIALLGKGGGTLASKCTHAIVVPGSTSDRIQELHMLILHIWVETIEAGLASNWR